MKRLKKTALLILVAVLCTVQLCSCALVNKILGKDDTEEPPPHTHEWGPWFTEITPTCKAGGQETRACACGETESLYLSATGAHLLKSNNTCRYCQAALTPTAGLEFEALSTSACQLIGIGTAVGTEIVIPNTYEGMSVTQIGIEALKDQTAVKNIILPESLKIIEESAFSGCTSLVSIAIPTAVTNIYASAFSCCYSLSSIDFGTGSKLKSIGKTAFYCTDLRTVDFGDNSALRTIGDSAFFFCMKLSSIRFGKNSVLTTVGPYAFNSCSSLTTVTLPDTVTSIKTYAFYDCKLLTDIILPKSLNSIANYAFYLCDKLTNIYYCGTVSDWDRISIGGEVGRYFEDATVYYYAENPPAGGNVKYWHYAPTPW